jgi:FkbM family methyltransferase
MHARQVAKTLAMTLPPFRRVLAERDSLREERDALIREREVLLKERDTVLHEEPDVVRDRLDASWQAGIATLPPFDAMLMRQRSKSRLSDFHPRYPFAVERGSLASQLQATDPNNRYGHEPELAHLIDLLIPDDGIYLDVGSNVGYFAVFLATRPNFHGHIHAFEPVASVFASLRNFIDALKCEDVVTRHQVAASDTAGTAKIAVAENLGESSLMDGNLEEGETVRKIALDSLNLERVDFMKVDVEGHEAFALRGARQIIERHKPFIFLESWVFEGEPERTFEPFVFLLERGYRLYLPCWAQSTGKFHVGIGPTHEMHTLALVPFAPEDRLVFAGNPINTFAAPASREAELGELWTGSKLRMKVNGSGH